MTDAMPYGMAQNALDAAKAKGIPIIITDQIPAVGQHAEHRRSSPTCPAWSTSPRQIAWWMIADSQGKANAIIAQESDSPSSIAYVQDSLSISSRAALAAPHGQEHHRDHQLAARF